MKIWRQLEDHEVIKNDDCYTCYGSPTRGLTGLGGIQMTVAEAKNMYSNLYDLQYCRSEDLTRDETDYRELDIYL